MAKKEKKKEDKKKKGEPNVVLERSYNVPLRREWLKSPRYKRSKKAISEVVTLKEYIPFSVFKI